MTLRLGFDAAVLSSWARAGQGPYRGGGPLCRPRPEMSAADHRLRGCYGVRAMLVMNRWTACPPDGAASGFNVSSKLGGASAPRLRVPRSDTLPRAVMMRLISSPSMMSRPRARSMPGDADPVPKDRYWAVAGGPTTAGTDVMSSAWTA